MLKHVFAIAIFWICFWGASHAQAIIRVDTTGYEQQRLKVNELLQQRSARFGRFEESLRQRTGIFGLKTKRDMQASIDILKEIVLMDNEIFKETKQLVDFKDFESEMVARQAEEFDGRINRYIATISKLQKEQAELRAQVEVLQASRQQTTGALVFVLVVLALGAVLGYVYYIRPKQASKKAAAKAAPSRELD